MKSIVTLQQIRATRGTEPSTEKLGYIARTTKYFATTREEVRTVRDYCRTDIFKDKVAQRTLDILNK